jgi:hypothetical protein
MAATCAEQMREIVVEKDDLSTLVAVRRTKTFW